MNECMKEEPIDPLVFLRGPHKHSEMQEQREQSTVDAGLSRRPYVSHVPIRTISVSSSNRSTSSTMCSVSSKEGHESDEMLPASIFSRIRSWTETSNSEGLNSEKLRTKPQSKQPFKKSLIAAADEDARNMVANRNDVKAESSSESHLPSIIITRPTKRARVMPIDFDDSSGTDTRSTSSASPTTRPISPLLPHGQQGKPQLLLLAQEEDESYLNPLHVFVRKQIEVFAATPTELAQPAPGRKTPIQLHQVGLRCIHCRHISTATSQKQKVKRAVCYPSTVGRIYHSVSDMKFDHFSNCKEIPSDVRKTFEDLKLEEKNAKKEKKSKSSGGKKSQSSASTAQYYRESASRMGLFDGPGGIVYMSSNHAGQCPTTQTTSATATPVILPQEPQCAAGANKRTLGSRKLQEQEHLRNLLTNLKNLSAANNAAVTSMLLPQMQVSALLAASKNERSTTTARDLKNLAAVMNSGLLNNLVMNAIAVGANAQKSLDAAVAKAIADQKPASSNASLQPRLQQQTSPPNQSSNGSSTTTPETNSPALLPETMCLPLACPEDETALNSLHCFVRKHLEVFAANEADIAAPAPGRKTRVVLGQVGIRCLHCSRNQGRKRVKRAVCYPPSIECIYHAVSNMKFDHFGICPYLPADDRAELAALKTSGSGRKPSGALASGMSTADYYQTSAIAKGLVDSSNGIRFATKVETTTIVNDKSPEPKEPIATEAKVAATTQTINGAAPNGFSALVMAAASQTTSI